MLGALLNAIWNRLKNTFSGRFLACVLSVIILLIYQLAKAEAEAKHKIDPKAVIAVAIVMPCIGVLAWLILEFMDWHKRKRRERLINKKVEQIHWEQPGLSHREARQVAAEAVDKRFSLRSCVVGFFLCIGFLSLSCGVIMTIIKIIEFFRGLLE